MSATESPTISAVDRVRGFLQQAFDNNIDLTVKSNRESMIKQFKELYPNDNQKTVQTLFGKEIPKMAKAYNINPDDVKQQPAKKFSKSNEITINATEKRSSIQSVKIQNPSIVGADPNKPVIAGIGQPVNYKYEIKSSQVSAFSNSIWGFAQLFCEDLEDFTEDEANDIGDLCQPYLQTKIGNSDRGQATMMVGGVLGITARKAKTARVNRKIRKAKESEEKNKEPKKDD